MDETGFLELADELSTGSREADWRTAISRAYYAAFHKAHLLLRQGGFRIPSGGQAHEYLWLRLSNTGHTDIDDAGMRLNRLRRMRNRADYDFRRPYDGAAAIRNVGIATDILQLLHQLANEPSILTRVLDSIKTYERDVLREITWHPLQHIFRPRSLIRRGNLGGDKLGAFRGSPPELRFVPSCVGVSVTVGEPFSQAPSASGVK